MTVKPHLPNVLAHRYASPELVELWSPQHKIVLERQLWLAVLRAQADLGVDVPRARSPTTSGSSTRSTWTPSPSANARPGTT
ncbi:hypothetical protein GCM10020366_09840 [Saccharopolyspora gregorii]|uniref:Adenylosuccinate lyase n=1 Tax=Saccharopolyspora gregorii TaxID=33914 RepID=A0ABP6RIE7_9PSEU